MYIECRGCLYILDINPLLVLFAHIFSHFVGCLFILFLFPLYKYNVICKQWQFYFLPSNLLFFLTY